MKFSEVKKLFLKTQFVILTIRSGNEIVERFAGEFSAIPEEYFELKISMVYSYDIDQLGIILVK